jgi:hypothetical protein
LLLLSAEAFNPQTKRSAETITVFKDTFAFMVLCLF